MECYESRNTAFPGVLVHHDAEIDVGLESTVAGPVQEYFIGPKVREEEGNEGSEQGKGALGWCAVLCH